MLRLCGGAFTMTRHLVVRISTIVTSEIFHQPRHSRLPLIFLVLHHQADILLILAAVRDSAASWVFQLRWICCKKNIQNSAGTPTFLTFQMDLPREKDSSYKSIVELISTCQQKQPATTSCSSVSLSLVVSNFLCLSITSLYLNSFTVFLPTSFYTSKLVVSARFFRKKNHERGRPEGSHGATRIDETLAAKGTCVEPCLDACRVSTQHHWRH